MKKSNEKKKPVPTGNIIMIVFGLILGIMLGAILSGADDSEKDISFMNLILCLAIFYLSVILGIIIHEAGHLVCGLMTGYKFISFRVGSFTLVKENGKLVKRKFTIAGTGGQCILTHEPVEKPEDVPYFWYHFGGGFFNLLCAVMGLIFYLILSNETAEMIFAVFTASSVILAMMNLIPIKTMGIPNDGYNIYLLHKSPENRRLIFNNMVVNGLQHDGIRLKDIPDELFCGGDPDGSIYETAQAILCANRELNRHDFESAKQMYERVLNNPDLVELYKNECKCELMFTRIVTGESKERITEIYDHGLQSYIKQTGKTYIMRKRLMYAYYLITETDNDKAQEEYQAAVKMKNTYPCRGEYDSEMEIIEYVKSNFGK